MLNLTQSYISTIIYALAKLNSPQARDTLRELERIGTPLPAWVKRDVLDN